MSARERDTQTRSFFFLSYSASARFLYFFFCVSLIQSFCYHPALVCNSISFFFLYFICFGFKDALFSFCSSALVFESGFNYFWYFPLLLQMEKRLPSTLLNAHWETATRHTTDKRMCILAGVKEKERGEQLLLHWRTYDTCINLWPSLLRWSV